MLVGLTQSLHAGNPSWICLVPILLLPAVGCLPLHVMRRAEAAFRRKLRAVPLPDYCDSARYGRKSV